MLLLLAVLILLIAAGVPIEASAVTINRFCSSGLQAIAFAAERIMVGAAETIVAGGTESMSLIPMGGHKIAPNPRLIEDYPDVYLSTGLVAENHAREAQVSREEQDAFALRSHQRAVAVTVGGQQRIQMMLPCPVSALSTVLVTDGFRVYRHKLLAAPQHHDLGTQ